MGVPNQQFRKQFIDDQNDHQSEFATHPSRYRMWSIDKHHHVYDGLFRYGINLHWCYSSNHVHDRSAHRDFRSGSCRVEVASTILWIKVVAL